MAVCAGLGLLPMDVTFHSAKVTLQAKGVLACDRGWLSESNGIAVSGYEIHTGTNDFREGCGALFNATTGRMERWFVTACAMRRETCWERIYWRV